MRRTIMLEGITLLAKKSSMFAWTESEVKICQEISNSYSQANNAFHLLTALNTSDSTIIIMRYLLLWDSFTRGSVGKRNTSGFAEPLTFHFHPCFSYQRPEIKSIMACSWQHITRSAIPWTKRKFICNQFSEYVNMPR